MVKRPASCLLCTRIGRNDMAYYAFQLWEENEDFARKVVDGSMEIINRVYMENPPLLCGRAPSAIRAALLYMVHVKMTGGIKDENRRTQTRICRVVGTSEATLRTLYVIIEGEMKKW